MRLKQGTGEVGRTCSGIEAERNLSITKCEVSSIIFFFEQIRPYSSVNCNRDILEIAIQFEKIGDGGDMAIYIESKEVKKKKR